MEARFRDITLKQQFSHQSWLTNDLYVKKKQFQTNVKDMLSVFFFNFNLIGYFEILPQGQIRNGECCKDVLQRLHDYPQKEATVVTRQLMVQ